MKKLFLVLLFFLITCNAYGRDTFGGSFVDFGPRSAFEIWLDDPNGYFGDPANLDAASPPSVQSALNELGASGVANNTTFLMLDTSNDPLSGDLDLGGHALKLDGQAASMVKINSSIWKLYISNMLIHTWDSGVAILVEKVLLETGDAILLENGTDNMLLE